jgi:hypothetical protein
MAVAEKLSEVTVEEFALKARKIARQLGATYRAGRVNRDFAEFVEVSRMLGTTTMFGEADENNELVLVYRLGH